MWTLKVPVHRYPQARQKPLLLFRRVNEFYLKATNADPGFAGCADQEPNVSPGPGHGHDLEAPWRLRAPGVSRGHPVRIERAPRKARTGVGRNVDLFTELMRWSGRKENAETCNQRFAAEGRGRLPVSGGPGHGQESGGVPPGVGGQRLALPRLDRTATGRGEEAVGSPLGHPGGERQASGTRPSSAPSWAVSPCIGRPRTTTSRCRRSGTSSAGRSDCSAQW